MTKVAVLGLAALAAAVVTAVGADAVSPAPPTPEQALACEDVPHATTITPQMVQQCFGDALNSQEFQRKQTLSGMGQYFNDTYAPAHPDTYAGLAGSGDGLELLTTGSPDTALADVPAVFKPLLTGTRQVTRTLVDLTAMAKAVPGFGTAGSTFAYAVVDIPSNDIDVYFTGQPGAQDTTTDWIAAQPDPTVYAAHYGYQVPSLDTGTVTGPLQTAPTSAVPPARPVPDPPGSAVVSSRFDDSDPWNAGDPIGLQSSLSA